MILVKASYSDCAGLTGQWFGEIHILPPLSLVDFTSTNGYNSQAGKAMLNLSITEGGGPWYFSGTCSNGHLEIQSWSAKLSGDINGTIINLEGTYTAQMAVPVNNSSALKSKVFYPGEPLSMIFYKY